jgi:hypothetical protein
MSVFLAAKLGKRNPELTVGRFRLATGVALRIGEIEWRDTLGHSAFQPS